MDTHMAFSGTTDLSMISSSSMFTVSAGTWNHVDIQRPCCHWRPCWMSVICAAPEGHDGPWSVLETTWMSVSYVTTEGYANAYCFLSKSTWSFVCLSVAIVTPRWAPSNWFHLLMQMFPKCDLSRHSLLSPPSYQFTTGLVIYFYLHKVLPWGIYSFEFYT